MLLWRERTLGHLPAVRMLLAWSPALLGDRRWSPQCRQLEVEGLPAQKAAAERYAG